MQTRQRYYRKISLVNTNAKLFNKIVANRLEEHIYKIVHHDQQVLILAMQRWFNTGKSINVIYYINRMKKKNPDDHLN